MSFYQLQTFLSFFFLVKQTGLIAVVSSASDIWSLGCMGYVLLCGLSPFLDEDLLQTALNIVDADVQFNQVQNVTGANF